MQQPAREPAGARAGPAYRDPGGRNHYLTVLREGAQAWMSNEALVVGLRATRKLFARFNSF